MVYPTPLGYPCRLPARNNVSQLSSGPHPVHESAQRVPSSSHGPPAAPPLLSRSPQRTGGRRGGRPDEDGDDRRRRRREGREGGGAEDEDDRRRRRRDGREGAGDEALHSHPYPCLDPQWSLPNDAPPGLNLDAGGEGRARLLLRVGCGAWPSVDSVVGRWSRGLVVPGVAPAAAAPQP